MQVTEQDVKNAVIDYMRRRGFYCDRMQSGKLVMQHKGGAKSVIILAEKGTPDLVACCDKHYVAIEVKKDEKEYLKWEAQWKKFEQTGKRTDANERSIDQHEKQQQMIKRGITVLNVYSLDVLESDLRTLGFIS